MDVTGIVLMVVATCGLVLTTSWTSLSGDDGYDWSDPRLPAVVLLTVVAAAAFGMVARGEALAAPANVTPVAPVQHDDGDRDGVRGGPAPRDAGSLTR